MKNLFHSGMLSLALVCGFAIFAGCSSPGNPPTREAIVFSSFQDTWTAAKSAYGGYCEQVVQGRVSKADEATVDAAWNRFRLGFKVAFKAASNNWTASTTADVEALKQDLLVFIYSL